MLTAMPLSKLRALDLVVFCRSDLNDRGKYQNDVRSSIFYRLQLL